MRVVRQSGSVLSRAKKSRKYTSYRVMNVVLNTLFSFVLAPYIHYILEEISPQWTTREMNTELCFLAKFSFLLVFFCLLVLFKLPRL